MVTTIGGNGSDNRTCFRETSRGEFPKLEESYRKEGEERACIVARVVAPVLRACIVYIVRITRLCRVRVCQRSLLVSVYATIYESYEF